MINKRILLLWLPLLMLFRAADAYAVGLGELTHRSHLGEPLEASINVLGADDYGPEGVNARLLSVAEAESLGIVLVDHFQQIRLRSVMQAGQLQLQLSTHKPVNEPFLNILVRLSWPEGRVMREYTLLLDPPALVSLPEQSASKATKVPQPVISSTQRAEQPARASAPTVSSPAEAVADDSAAADGQPGWSEQRYQVVSGDSLSRIAARLAVHTQHRRDELAQWLLNENPRAFIDDNPNLIKAGSWLQLPARGQALPPVKGRSRPSAVRSVAATVSPTEQPALNQELTAEEAVLSIATPESAQSEGSSEEASLSAQLMATRETIDMLLRENRELRMRLDRMEQSGLESSLKQLLALKDQQIADLEKRVGQGSAGAAAVQIAGNEAKAPLTVTASGNAAKKAYSEQYSTWLVVAIIALALIGGIWWLLSKLGPEDTPYAVASVTGNDKQSVMDKLTPGNRKPEPRWRPDDEVHQDIARKMQSYEPGVYDDTELVMVSPVEESIAEALSFASSGSLELAEAILLTVRAEVGEDQRVEDALQQLEELREQRSQV